MRMMQLKGPQLTQPQPTYLHWSSMPQMLKLQLPKSQLTTPQLRHLHRSKMPHMTQMSHNFAAAGGHNSTGVGKQCNYNNMLQMGLLQPKHLHWSSIPQMTQLRRPQATTMTPRKHINVGIQLKQAELYSLL